MNASNAPISEPTHNALTPFVDRVPGKRWLRSVLLLGVLLLTGRLEAEPRFARDGEAIDQVIELVDRRLSLMPEVAAGKFRQQKPIADPAREREVIEQSSADAEAIHLNQ